MSNATSKTIRSGRFTFTANVVEATASKVIIRAVSDTGWEQRWSYLVNGARLSLCSVSEVDSTEIEDVRPELRKALGPMARKAWEKAVDAA